MNPLEKVRQVAISEPNRLVFLSPEGTMTYGQLWEWSGRLSRWILNHSDFGEGEPVPVWGHKSPWMLVVFLGLIRSGHGYCPLDVSLPPERVRDILQVLPENPFFCLSPLPKLFEAERKTLSLEEVRQLCQGREEVKQLCQGPEGEAPTDENWVRGEKVFYIIFTSGSTGSPKGVMITEKNLSGFLDWSVDLGSCRAEKEGAVFLNQAPFSFDLSVMDLYTCLACGGTLYCLTREVQKSYQELILALVESKAQVWVSTPSFAQVCLADPAFGEKLLPGLRTFLFCGETLPNKTASRLLKAFPGAQVINTYGPTESTVAVTGVNIDLALSQGESPLPIGSPRPGTRVEIWDSEGELCPEGESGEIVLLGDTVSPGYYKSPELTKKAFFTREGVRGYHTGDAGFLKEGMLYYGGRLDLQVKLHGYRIELGDIEENLRCLPGVLQAVVLPRYRRETLTSLQGAIVADEGFLEREGLTQEEYLGRLREGLSKRLPEYMIPKKLCLVEDLPMTNNGKVDRRALAGRLK